MWPFSGSDSKTNGENDDAVAKSQNDAAKAIDDFLSAAKPDQRSTSSEVGKISVSE